MMEIVICQPTAPIMVPRLLDFPLGATLLEYRRAPGKYKTPPPADTEKNKTLIKLLECPIPPPLSSSCHKNPGHFSSHSIYDILSEQGYTSLPRRYQKSDALHDPHNFFKKYHVKAYDQSFPMMYNTI